MALAETTLSSAVAETDTSIKVASATSIVAGVFLLVDGEVMQATKDYVSGTTVNVIRGLNGTKQVAHVATARVTHGVASDFGDNAQAQSVLIPAAGRTRDMVSYSAASTVDLPKPGSDRTVVINGTSVVALTIPVPNKDMDGCELNIVSNGAAAHTLTFTGGLSGASSNYDVITINATAPAAFKFIACNELWMAYCQPPMGGTVTNIIGSVA